MTAAPGSIEEAARLLREHGQAGRAVRLVGGGTKLNWGAGPPADGASDAVDVETGGLDAITEYNVGDFTAVLQAGVRLADAQAAFAAEGQMLALDPPLGASEGATIGGMMATADSGPLRHRYGGVRDLVVGVTVVLSDGTVAKAGGRVIKNVAGYDLAKLFAGSYGTLGMIASVSVRLHPKPELTATALAGSDDPERLARAAIELAAHPLEAERFDVAWEGDAGRLLVGFGGSAAGEQAEETVERLRAAGLEDAAAEADDAPLWDAQRDAQRSPDGFVVKVSGRPTDLAAVIRTACEQGGGVVSRAALGLSWLRLPAAADVAAVRQALAPRPCTVLDGAERVSEPWPEAPAGALAVMERVKERFDPARIFRPGAFVGGI